MLSLAHAQLLDSALPIGSFAHSFGLETFIARGEISSARDLHQFLHWMLFNAWAPGDALMVKGVYLYITEEPGKLWELDSWMDAARVSRETREGMRKIGRQAIRLGTTLAPNAPWGVLQSALRENRCPGSWPLVYGWWAHGLEVSLEQAATGYLYTCCTGALSVAVRLSLIGQQGAGAILASLLPQIELAWGEVEERDPFDFSFATPGLDIAQMGHEVVDPRLFMS